MHVRKIAAALAAALLIGASLMSGTATAVERTSETSELIEIDGVITDAPVQTRAELNAFLASSTPKTVVQDTVTGEIVEARLDSGVSPLSVIVNKPCKSGNLCLQPYATPYANFGFSGAGTKTGSWSYMRYWTTGSWYGKTKVSGGSLTAQWLGPNTISYYSSYPVTVEEVRLAISAVGA